MLKKASTAKLFLAASLAFGTILSVLPVPAQAEDVAETKIDSATQAISRAKALNLIPEGTRATAKLSGEKWDVTFETDEKDEGGSPLHVGQIIFHAKNGKVAKYHERLRSDFRGKPGENPFDESKMKFSTAEVQDIALELINQRNWKLDVSWMFNPYPIAYENDRRFEIARLHGVHFDGSHDGIRDGSNRVGVTVDRWTGEVDSYYIDWEEGTYIPEKVSEADLIGIDAAGKLLFDAIEPFLKWQAIKDPEQPKLVYALHEKYVITYDGKFPVEYQWENPPFTEEIKPSYSRELVKKRLLSMYDLNLEYIDGKLAYKLRLKPEITSFRSGLHPVIDAHTGEWLDFLNQPLTKTFSPAGEWLIYTAPDSEIEYAAAILWDNELLQLENEPFIKNSYTLVPFRELMTKLGAKINWDPVARKVTASKDGTTIELTIDSNTTSINGKEQTLEAPAIIKDGRTYIPVRLVLETFNVHVGWSNESRLVLVSSDGNPLVLSPEEKKKYRFQAQLNWENKMHK
ncbi:copper amine oxidase N-terminal domain-containing protein [Paenibacillus ginsengarvi]|uniref:Copper amine oxidase N-terminal domain-containing protein n=1 Tax=Paenibacillus ginsengarvi TaxID=400777 RepID=A0A3B0CG36_9BACL|nr:copper amine oxidase N-terminal domain-containing protein [Paenibacillus ginsengarvi]RKN84533.1 copper amine oxidase N-terminal domain-containing protein [Paenibacillus ginsengarvi]